MFERDDWNPSAGTLLGAVRSNNLMSHDYKFSDGGPQTGMIDRDVDLAAFISDRSKTRSGSSFEFDLREEACWIEEDGEFKTRIYAKAGTILVHIDLWWYELQRDLGGVSVYVWDQARYPWYMLPEMFFNATMHSWCHIYDEKFPCPWNPELLLELMYGASWRVPIPKDYSTNPHADPNTSGQEDFSNFIARNPASGMFHVKPDVLAMISHEAAMRAHK